MQYKNNIIGKILTPINRKKFKRFVDKYKGDFAAKRLHCWEQFVAILLGQLGNCSSLREIEATVQFHANEHYHLGLKGNIARSTLADANEHRDWRIYRDLCFDLISNLSNFEIQDFLALTDDYKNTRDIITNPPYKLATKMVRKALDISEDGVKIAMFLRLTFLEGQERRKLIFDNDPPRYVFPFSKRIFVAKDGVFPKGSAVAYCWIVWEKGYKGKPEIIWLN